MVEDRWLEGGMGLQNVRLGSVGMGRGSGGQALQASLQLLGTAKLVGMKFPPVPG